MNFEAAAKVALKMWPFTPSDAGKNIFGATRRGIIIFSRPLDVSRVATVPVTVGKNSQYSVGVFQDTAKGFTVYNCNKWYKMQCRMLFHLIALCYEMEVGLQISMDHGRKIVFRQAVCLSDLQDAFYVSHCAWFYKARNAEKLNCAFIKWARTT